MPQDDRRSIVSILLARVADGADATGIAEDIVTALGQVEIALGPIVGKRGVAALLKRSLHLANARHPWLRADFEDSGESLDYELLRSSFAGRSDAETAAAGGDLLRGFRELLATLIGASLTEQLLGEAWSHLTSGPSA